MSNNARVASRNNPSTRGVAREFMHKGQKIKPVKLVTEKSTYFAAEYENGELVLGSKGLPLPWSIARG